MTGLPFRENPRQAGDFFLPWVGYYNVRIHDLRRTFGSWLTTQGQGLAVVARALNQSTLHTTQIYAHLADDPVRLAVAEHAQRLLPDAPPKKLKKSEKKIQKRG